MTRPVRCLETGEVWRSYAAAARALGMPAARIRDAAINGIYYRGKRFRLVYDEDRQEAQRYVSYRPGHAIRRRARLLECEDGRRFSSLIEAAAAIRVPPSTLRSAIYDYRPCKGLYFRYLKTEP